MKYFIFTLVLIINIKHVNAQNSNVGIKSGYNHLTVKETYGSESESTNYNRVHFGIFVEIDISEKFQFQPELLYTNTTSFSDNLGFLVLPLLFEYHTSKKMDFQLGPQLDYGLGDFYGIGFKKLGLSIVGGISYNISDDFLISGRYALGLTNRLDRSDFNNIDFADDPSFRNLESKFRIFEISLGYRF
ncbi:porin family protein [Winogradskyella sp. A3E31]|uniref:porin family protein n=1 Tax=Winogradskyella sp. A3E31 TaxID=3349637 RepID=UPI00398B7CE4